MTKEYPVGATKTSLEIVEAIKEFGEVGVSELAQHLELPKSTLHDHLKTLEQAEYLVKEGDAYRVGARFLEFGGYARRQLEIFRVAKPELKGLAEKTGEHANLMIEEHGMGIFLMKREGEEAVQIDTYAGKRVHLHTTALGKAILANLPEERVEHILDYHGLPTINENTIGDKEELFEALDEIRDRGYAIDDQERIEGMRCIGVPIQDDDDRILGAISVSGPKNRMDGERFTDEIPKMVLRTANVIEVNLTYS